MSDDYQKLDLRLMALPPHLRVTGSSVLDQMQAPGLWVWIVKLTKLIIGRV